MSLKLNTVVADDEPLALEYMQTLLSRHPSINIVASVANGAQALQAVKQESPHLLVMDIEMPCLNAFEVIQAIQADNMPLVIFASAYDSYALDAFELHAVDYVLKPIDPERLYKAVDRAADRYLKELASAEKGPLIDAGVASGRLRIASELVEHYSGDEEPQHPGRLVVRDGHELTFVNLKDIDWIDAAGDYMCLHVGDKIEIMRSTMKQLIERLPESQFTRIHRSTIVNLEKIQRAETLPKGEFLIFLGDEVSLKVSRNYRSGIASLLR